MEWRGGWGGEGGCVEEKVEGSVEERKEEVYQRSGLGAGASASRIVLCITCTDVIHYFSCEGRRKDKQWRCLLIS